VDRGIELLSGVRMLALAGRHSASDARRRA
jgi:hypothetical protein